MPGGVTTPVGRLLRALPPGSFAFVMATGIVANALGQVGWRAVSAALLAVSIVALVLLAAAWVWRLCTAPTEVFRLTGRPETAFGFLTVVAAVNVVSVGLQASGMRAAGIVLAIVGAVLWLVLGYGVPLRLVLRRRGEVATHANGTWFLWVVATQSVTVAVADADRAHPGELLGTVAVVLWGIGTMLYLMLVTLVTLRLLTTPQSPGRLDPSYWIYMGATAITTLAGATIIAVLHPLHIVHDTAQVIGGLTVMLWAFGLWWVPFLAVLGVWRHGVRRVPLRYSTALWSIVFPLGMISAASIRLGQVGDLVVVHRIGEAGSYVAAAAWLAAAAAMTGAGARALLRHRNPAGPPTASAGGAAPGDTTPGDAAPDTASGRAAPAEPAPRKRESTVMPAYTRRPLEVQAHRWEAVPSVPLPPYLARWEVAADEHGVDPRCGAPWHDHAITTDAAHRPVCPGQWAVREIDGEVRVLDDADFRRGYLPAG